MIKKVISGGQTGIDQLALVLATLCNIQTGGTAPKGWRTEDGPNENLKSYGLVEHYSSEYPPRTGCNVNDSDGTVLFGNTESSGLRLTINVCIKLGKPYIKNPTADQFITFVNDNSIEILNIAGNRFSTLTKDQMWNATIVLSQVFSSSQPPTND